jgi:hypothetical protein
MNNAEHSEAVVRDKEIGHNDEYAKHCLLDVSQSAAGRR